MRLIDADTLNQYKFGEQLMTSSYSEGWDDAIDAIMKDAPTVVVRDNYDIGYVEGLEDGKQRLQGEWGIHGECPFCSYIRKWKEDNYCGNCGARLKKEEST